MLPLPLLRSTSFNDLSAFYLMLLHSTWHMAAPPPLEPALFLPAPQQHSLAAQNMPPPPSLTDADLSHPDRVDAAVQEGENYFVAIKRARNDPFPTSTRFEDERDASRYVFDANLARKMPDIARVTPPMVNAQLVGVIQQIQVTLREIQVSVREVQVTQQHMQVAQQHMQLSLQHMQHKVEDLSRISVNTNAAMPYSPVLPLYNDARILPINFPATREDFDGLTARHVNDLIRFYSIPLRNGATMGTKKTALRHHLHLH